MTDTEPLDLDAVYARWADWYNDQAATGDWSLRDPDESLSHCLAREDIPVLMDEVRRLREETDRLRAQYIAIREAGR